MTFTTKDSGKRAEYASGMQRDTEEGKARFDLLFPLDIPFEAQMLTRFANLMTRGAQKYDERNWEKARGEEEMARYRSSAMRHLVQWETGETDEDHAAAVMFNLMAHETVKYRLDNESADFGMTGRQWMDMEQPDVAEPPFGYKVTFPDKVLGEVKVMETYIEDGDKCCTPNCVDCGEYPYLCENCDGLCACKTRTWARRKPEWDVC